MIEADARIIELEAQRNFFATRCTQFAAEIALLRNAVATKDAAIGALQSQLAEHSAPKTPDPDPQP